MKIRFKNASLVLIICAQLGDCFIYKKNPTSVRAWPGSRARSSPVLLCNGRFYQGYRLKKGDSGEIVYQNAPNTNLCLWKFFPQNCRLSFSCSEFSVSTGSSDRTCPTKLVTKVDQNNAKRWCGSVKPPLQTRPLRSRKPVLVGYMAFKGLLGAQNVIPASDRFTCRIGCSGTAATTSQTSSAPLKCKCGETSARSNRVKVRSGLSRAFLPATFSRAVNIQDLLGLSSSSFSRIVGGVAAEEGSVPWQVSLAVSSSNIFCGATLVTDRHLVTAAHCLAGVDTSVLGQVDILLNEYNTEDSKKPILRKIRKVVIHPQFNENTLRNDIAVVTLRRGVSLVGGPIAPACLPSPSYNPIINSVATVTGFGTTSAASDEPSSRLLSVDVNIISNSDCMSKNDVYSSKVVNTMLCAGVSQGGKDACKRDSGGPLVTSAGGKNTLIGVVSWGQGCAEAKYPGVYTRVSSYRAWIDTQLAGGRKCQG